MKEITDVLKEAAGDILTEEVLEQIQTVFNETVEERVSLQVEKALVEQDEEHASKLGGLLEAIDADHTGKLNKVIEAIDNNHSQKLAAVVKKYEAVVNESAGDFKGSLVESISSYLDEYLEEHIPTEQIDEAVRNKHAVTVLEGLRKDLAVNFALSKDYIKDAINDGKEQLDEAGTQVTQLQEANAELTNKVTVLESHVLLTEKTADLPSEKAQYVYRVLSNKSVDFINENFDYTVRLFDKTEEEKLEEYKKQAATKTQSVDRPILEKTEPQTAEDPMQENPSHVTNLYMGELNKF